MQMIMRFGEGISSIIKSVQPQLQAKGCDSRPMLSGERMTNYALCTSRDGKSNLKRRDEGDGAKLKEEHETQPSKGQRTVSCLDSISCTIA
jgi:hypothetical protein